MKEVEAMINSRPLAYEGAETRDELVLRPNYFLVGQLGGQLLLFLLKALSLRYHFIKNALAVSRFHNQIFKETIQLLRYIYIYEI